MKYNLICKTSECSTQGSLCVAESQSSEVPFEIKRVYYIYDVHSGVTRGFHAHKTLQQVLICVHGKIRITLDDGKNVQNSYILDSPSSVLYVGPNLWRTMEWIESGSVLLVLASEHYDEADYIRNYESFIDWASRERK